MAHARKVVDEELIAAAVFTRAHEVISAAASRRHEVRQAALRSAIAIDALPGEAGFDYGAARPGVRFLDGGEPLAIAHRGGGGYGIKHAEAAQPPGKAGFDCGAARPGVRFLDGGEPLAIAQRGGGGYGIEHAEAVVSLVIEIRQQVGEQYIGGG